MASIDQLPGGSIRVRWRYNGAAQSLSFEDKDKALEAKALAEAHRHAKDKTFIYSTVMGLPLPGQDVPATGGPTVASLVPGYITSLLEAQPRQKRDNRRKFEAAALPVIGEMPAAAVTTVEITEIMDQIKRRRVGGRPIKKRTVDRYYNVMKGFFSYTIKIGVRTTNPVKEIDWKPLSLAKYNAGRKEDAHFYMTKDQFKVLRSHFSPGDQLLLHFMAQTGARWGEATAVKVQAFKLKRGQHPMLEICDAWKEDEDSTYYVGDPKAGSNRVISVRLSLVTKLQPLLTGKKKAALVFQEPDGKRIEYHVFKVRWNAAVNAAMRCDLHPPKPQGRPTPKEKLAGPRCRDNGGITERGRPCGQWVSPGWDRCKDHLGVAPDAESECECWDRRLPKRPQIHDLRHTHVAWLLAGDNISLKAIAMRLGHSVEVLENVYAGLLREIDDRIIDAIAIDDEDEAA